MMMTGGSKTKPIPLGHVNDGFHGRGHRHVVLSFSFCCFWQLINQSIERLSSRVIMRENRNNAPWPSISISACHSIRKRTRQS